MTSLPHFTPARSNTLRTALSDWRRARRILEKRNAATQDNAGGFFYRLFTMPTRLLGWLCGAPRGISQTPVQQQRFAFAPVRRQTTALAFTINARVLAPALAKH